MDLPNLQSIAVELSKTSCASYHQHGALLVRKGRIISSAVNDENAHAEVNAVLKGYRLLCEKREKC